jgi:putative peptidoglycan lipid II flippase
LSYGVTLAGVLQLVFLFFVTLKFYKPTLTLRLKANNKVKKFFKKLIPSIFSSGITQINILIGTIIASYEAGAVSYLYYADRIYQINLAIAGIAVGTVSLPALSKAFKNKNIKKLSNIQSKSFELSLLLSIPASLGLILASEEIVNSLFGYGSFSEKDVKLTADALKYFGYGVPAFALVKILSNFFFARDNTKTPLYISIFMVIINISISVSLFGSYGFIIIPIATSISTWTGVLFYIYLLNEKNSLLLNEKLIPNFIKILASTIIMSIIMVLLINNYESYLNYSYKFKAIYLLSIVGFVGIVYLLSCYLFGILKLKDYKTN